MFFEFLAPLTSGSWGVSDVQLSIVRRLSSLHSNLLKFCIDSFETNYNCSQAHLLIFLFGIWKFIIMVFFY